MSQRKHAGLGDGCANPLGSSRSGAHARKVVLSHWTALWYYRLSNIGLLPLPYECDDCGFDDATANLDYLTDKDRSLLSISTADYAARYIYVADDVRKAYRGLDPAHRAEAISVATASPYRIPLADKLDVLVGGKTRRLAGEGVRAHRQSSPLPEGSIRRIGSNLYIVSPELMFVQVSSLLKEPHLVAALATELAGTYALLPSGMVRCEEALLRGEEVLDAKGYLKGDGYCDALPLTTCDGMRGYVADVEHVHGSNLATKGLRASVDHSASPFETAIDVSLALSRSWGGAGCGVPEANKDVPLNDEGQRIAGKGKVIADALFTSKHGHRIDVEPGGKAWHSGKDAMVSDNDRRLALERQRIEVIVVPWKTFKDPHAWRHVCGRVACHLGKNFHVPTNAMLQRWKLVHEDFCDTNLLKRLPRGRR